MRPPLCWRAWTAPPRRSSRPRWQTMCSPRPSWWAP